MDTNETNPRTVAAGADRRELEWQLAAADLGGIRRWLSEHPAVRGLVIEPRSGLDILDTYYDTDDWRMYRAGYALRLRAAAGGSEATLKELRSARKGLLDRRELSEPVEAGGDEPLFATEGPVGTRVKAVAGARPLRRLFEVRTHRQRFAVSNERDATEIGEIALDETRFAQDGVPTQAEIRRVEVESSLPDAEPLEHLVEVLRSECALKPSQDSKYALGLQAAGLAPPRLETAPPRLLPSMRIDQVAMAWLATQVADWQTHEAGARLGEDPEELHDLRVATRHMSAALALFEDYLPATLTRMRGRLESLLTVLGAVRDLDVQILELDRFAAGQSDADRMTLLALRRQLERERARSRERMCRTLDAAATRRWLARMQALVSKPWTPRPGSRRVAAVITASELLRRRYRKFRKAADAVTPRSPADSYHAVRRQAKKLRYALESVQELYGKPAVRFLRQLRRLQDCLGDYQDAAVAIARLSSRAAGRRAGLSSATLFLMGRLAEHHGTRATRAREAFPKALRRVRGKRWKELRRKLDKLARNHEPPSRPARKPVAASHRE